MARLIDAELLKQNCKCTGKFEDNFMCVDLIELAKVIDAQPTAYNVEKVVEQLEDMKKEETEGCSTIKGKYCSEYKFCGCCIIDRAIEIVRKGGVE